MNFKWEILLFAGLVDRLGGSAISIEASVASMQAGQLKALIGQQFNEHSALIGSSFIAANGKYCTDETEILNDMEIALLPPVSGGDGQSKESVRPVLYDITEQPLNAEEIANKVICKEHGASILFIGTTREFTEGKRTTYLHYEAYKPMALKTLEQIGDEIFDKFNGAKCAISHRLGKVDLAETSVIIAVSAPHRDSCYEASRYAIERLKQIVPIWKKEIWEDGSEWKGHQLGPWDPITQ